MKHFVQYFIELMPAMLVAGAFIAIVDALYFSVMGDPPPSDFGLLLHSMWLGVGLTVAVSAVLGVLVVLALPAVRAVAALRGFGQASAVEFVAALRRLLVLDGKWGARSVGLALAPLIIGVVVAYGDDYVVPSLRLNNVINLMAYALLNTAAVVVPVVLIRLVGRRWPALQPYSPIVWAVLSGWAYYIAIRFWVGASYYTVFASFPLMLAPGTAAILTLIQRFPRSRRGVEVLALLLFVMSGVVLVSYPDRSPAHSYMHSGPIIGSGAWLLLAQLSDLDGDGSTHILGGMDCDGFSYAQRPSALEIAGNGIDDNCMGGDLPAGEPLSTELPEPRWLGREKPPIILITVDTLRADAVGKIVDDRQVTPVIDALHEGSVAFSRAYSVAAHTDEAIPALMTGMYPSDWHQYGVYFGVERTLAELLGAVGYQSIAVILLPWIRASLIHGFHIVDNSLGERHLRNERFISSTDTTKLALKRLDARDPEKPVFLWVHYFDAHAPTYSIVADDAWLADDLYLQNVHLVDSQIGEFLTGLDERDLLDDAVVVLASDHGEALGDHNLITHKWGIWESIMRVPLALRLPGIAPRKIEVPVSLVDVMPTLLDYLRLDGGTPRDGATLLPLIFGQNVENRPVFIESEVSGPTFFGVIDSQLKFFVDLKRAAYHLYDVEADPKERYNLIDVRPADAERLERMLGEWRDRTFNDRRLDRKRALWETRSAWRPEEFITSDESIRMDETLDD